jgi:glycosyltransferase involved in cell wall biosynthesis
MKKIIFIHLLNDYSGSPKVLSQVIKASLKKGYKIELYTGRSNNGFLSNLSEHHHFYFYKRFENRYMTLATFILSQISLFFKLLKYRNQDVIFYINTMLPFGAAIAGKLTNKKIYYHIHETSLRPPALKKFLRYIIKNTVSNIIFVSQYVQKEEVFPNKDQTVVYNALSYNYVQVANQHNYQWKNEGLFSVLMVCSLKAYKGINEFIEIAQQCSQTKDISFTLIFNAEQSEIDLFFSKIKLPLNISVFHQKTDLVPYYRQTSLLLNLSKVDECKETFGLTIIEAMAFGIPVIVPPVGGPTEIVTEGVEGFLISSQETNKISHKIIEISNDETTCLELSKNAKKCSKYFKQEVFEKNILKVISE